MMFPAIPRYAAPEYRTDPEAMAAHGFSEAQRRWRWFEVMGSSWDMNGDIHMGLSENVGYIPNYSHLIGIMIINHWV